MKNASHDGAGNNDDASENSTNSTIFRKTTSGGGLSIPKETDSEGVPDGQEEVSLARNRGRVNIKFFENYGTFRAI